MEKLNFVLEDLSGSLRRKDRTFLSRMSGQGRIEGVLMAMMDGEAGELKGADKRLHGLLVGRSAELIAALDADTDMNAGVDTAYVPYPKPLKVVEPEADAFRCMVAEALSGLRDDCKAAHAANYISDWGTFLKIAEGEVPRELRFLGGHRSQLVNRAAAAVRGFHAQVAEAK